MTPDERDTLTHALTPDRFARIRAVFEAALERKASDRAGYVDGACGDDNLLRQEVLRMLAAEAQPDALLDAHSTHPPSSAPEEGRFPAGTTLAGRYRILGMLGRGGMGEVYKAHDLILNQAVALKFLSPAHISEAALIRFRNEVRIARQVSHPNVCRVYDLGMVEGLHFLSMEYIDGEDLASLLRRIGRLPQDKAIEFTRKICAGLGAAHERGVLHRDLKPANIMIDGRGQVRITDFGLAGLAAEIPLSDIRSGTPAYMSPEQKAGKEVTTRSDIYSLGLVLFEMFTGKQRKTGTDTNPTEIVKDLDPAIERLILRCLDEDPKRRPAAAINVAMGLPGADPIAAALAAGETPSPEMVAASQEKEGFSSLTAILCFVAILVALGAGIAIQAKVSLVSRAPMELPPDAMAERVRSMLRSIAYTEAPYSSSYGYTCCAYGAAEYVAGLPPSDRDQSYATHRPPIASFYYRQEAKQDVPVEELRSRLFPDEENPVLNLIRVQYDAAGRLTWLEVSPGAYPRLDEAVDWSRFFTEAGLNFSRFTRVSPDPNPRIPLDEQFAWEGDYGTSEPRVRVEAGARGGRPALFEVQPKIPPPQTFRTSWGGVLALTIVGAVLIGMLTLSIRNSRQGRGDRKGGFVVASVAAILAVGSTVLGPEYRSLTLPTPTALLLPALLWLIYRAIEPYVRRHWPDALISWSRLCAAKVHNPLVASHVLAGLVVAEIWGAALGTVAVQISEYYDLGGLTAGLSYLDGTGAVVDGWMTFALQGLTLALLFLMLVTLLRLAIRKLWVADLLAAIFTVFPMVGAHPLVMPVAAAWFSFMWLLRRFGFLSFLVVWTIQATLVYYPLTVTGWIASRSLMLHMVPVAIGTWALWVILTEKRLSATTETAA